MSIDKFGNYHDRPHVSYMQWRPDGTGEKQLGLRIGYGNGFTWIPEHEAINLANQLVDFIESRPNSPAAQEDD